MRRPGRREWFALDPARALPTRLLIRNAGPNGLELEHYYVSPEIRGPIREELRDVQVYPFWSYAAQSLAVSGLSPSPRTTPGTNRSSRCSSGRCRSTTSAQFRVISDRANGRYRVKHKDAPATALWPSQSTDVLLGEASARPGSSRRWTTRFTGN